MTVTITTEYAKAELERLAKENPDKVVDCYYTNRTLQRLDDEEFEEKGAPMCIVGQAFYDAGVSLKTLTTMDNWLGQLQGLPLNEGREELSNLDIAIEKDAYILLANAQAVQDNRNTWSDAVKFALGDEDEYVNKSYAVTRRYHGNFSDDEYEDEEV